MAFGEYDNALTKFANSRSSAPCADLNEQLWAVMSDLFRIFCCGSILLPFFLFFAEVFAMKTIDQPALDLAAGPAKDQAPAQDSSTESTVIEPTINGFDCGTLPIFREPSLYLSIAIVFIATSVCLSKTPTVFWLSLVAMTAVAVMFHIMAERFLFRANR